MISPGRRQQCSIACELFSSVSSLWDPRLHGCGSLARGMESGGVSYRIPIQQGNMLDQERVNQLQLGWPSARSGT